MDGNDWPAGPVQVSVAGKAECFITMDSPGGFFNGAFPGGCDAAVGDFVAFDQGTTHREHQVRNLAITSVDPSTNTVQGTADSGASVQAWVHGYEQTRRWLPVVDGIWSTDFGGFDLVEGMCGRSEIRDEQGNSTAVDWCIPNPTFLVSPEQEWFHGRDWPDGATVSITVEGKPECTTAKESWGASFSGSFGAGCDVVVGDTVTFFDGATTRTHTVRELGVTEVDKVANTVSGTAPIGEVVHVGLHGYGGTAQQLTVTDGTWLADFGLLDPPFDLKEGMCGRAEIRDDQGNSTAVDWCIPNPNFVVFPEWEWFDGRDWPDGATVTITVEGKPICTTAKESWGGFFNGSFGAGCDVAVGDTVTFFDGETTRTHTVRDLAITSVDEVANTVSGTAYPFAEVYVWQHEPGEQPRFGADEDGEWMADLNGYYDIRPGMCGRSEIRDDQGNATAVDWCVPPPQEDLWSAVFTYEPPEGVWTSGEYVFKFDVKYSVPGSGENIIGMMFLTVSEDAPLYDGYVLLGPWQRPLARTQEGCSPVDSINPAQRTRFSLPWDFWIPMTQDEAVDHFNSIEASVAWFPEDMMGGGSGPLLGHEILKTEEVDWAAYTCGFTS